MDSLPPPPRGARRLSDAKLEAVGGGFAEVSFYALGSRCELTFRAASGEAGARFIKEAADWLDAFELKYSRFIPSSLTSQINRLAGLDWVNIDPATEQLLDMCGYCFWLSGGAFDATALPLELLWDWKAQHDELPDEESIERARRLVSWPDVQRGCGKVFLPKKGMMLDFGGIGKEAAADCVAALAERCGIRDILVNLGGDIVVRGRDPEGDEWHVGLEDPSFPERCYCTLRLGDGLALATSGDYRRFFKFEDKLYGHIVDCRTGRPVSHGTRAVSVVARSCAMAGALATTGMIFGGLEAVRLIEKSPPAEGCVWSNGKVLETKLFRKYLALPGS